MQDATKSESRTEIVELILRNLVPKFSDKKLKYDAYQIASKLIMQNDGSFKKLNAQAKFIRHAL